MEKENLTLPETIIFIGKHVVSSDEKKVGYGIDKSNLSIGKKVEITTKYLQFDFKLPVPASRSENSKISCPHCNEQFNIRISSNDTLKRYEKYKELLKGIYSVLAIAAFVIGTIELNFILGFEYLWKTAIAFLFIIGLPAFALRGKMDAYGDPYEILNSENGDLIIGHMFISNL